MNFFREITGFFFKTNGPLSSAIQKFCEITKLPRCGLDQTKPNCIGFSMKDQIDGSPVSVNSFIISFNLNFFFLILHIGVAIDQ